MPARPGELSVRWNLFYAIGTLHGRGCFPVLVTCSLRTDHILFPLASLAQVDIVCQTQLAAREGTEIFTPVDKQRWSPGPAQGKALNRSKKGTLGVGVLGRASEEKKRGKARAQISPGVGVCKMPPTMVGEVEPEPGRPFGASYLP